jgi:hypothetical protein
VPAAWVERSAVELDRAASAAQRPSAPRAAAADGAAGSGGAGASAAAPHCGATVAWFEKGHSMLGSAGEARAVCAFLAPLLHRSGAWERDPDVVEVGPTGVATVTRVEDAE